jgi:hypothetical protein
MLTEINDLEAALQDPLKPEKYGSIFEPTLDEPGGLATFWM